VNNTKIKIFIEVILINLFILNLSVGTISNYSGKIFLLKGLVSFFLIIAMVTNYKITNYKWQQMTMSSGFKKLLAILFLFIGYLSLTLIYSSNPEYGFQKVLNFIISIVPSIIVFYYLISTLNELRIKLFLYSISAITIISVTFIIIDYPFDQNTIYYYKPGRWSHVIYGRMISSFAVFLLLYLIWMIKRGETRLRYATAMQAKEIRLKIFFLMFITSIAVYGTYLSALRAAFIGLILVGGGLLVTSLWLVVRSLWFKNLSSGKRTISVLTKNEEPAFRSGRLSTQELRHTYERESPVCGVLSAITIIAILTVLLIILLPKPGIINFRFDNMAAINDLQFKGDPAIYSRLEAWELSWEMIKEHPLFGTGLGGFNGYNNIEWTKAIKYSHNIILEMTAEGGVVGLLVLGSLLVVMFNNIFNFERTINTSNVSHFTFHFVLLTFFLFALWLALFSKEFSNQSLLWIGLAFVGMGREALRFQDIGDIQDSYDKSGYTGSG